LTVKVSDMSHPGIVERKTVVKSPPGCVSISLKVEG